MFCRTPHWRTVAVSTAFLAAASTLVVALPASAQQEAAQENTTQEYSTQTAGLLPLEDALASKSSAAIGDGNVAVAIG